MTKIRYRKQWKIPSNSDPDKRYTVSLTMDGKYICHCWPFLRTREECSHIMLAKSGAYDNIEPASERERSSTLLQQYAEKGYRYLTWFDADMRSWDKRSLDLIKRAPDYEDVKTFSVDSRKVVVVKEKPEVYQREIDNFANEIRGYDFRKVRNRERVKEQLHKKYFDLTQHILFNSTGVINPNLPEGSVYNRGIYGSQLHRLSMRYKWLR